MGDGVSFAGDGGKDISVNQAGTNPGNLAGGAENVIDFAGDGGKDVDHANVPKDTTTSVPSGDEVQFVGGN